ncbi:GMC oxidoreductase [Nonomuraea roseoviolacea]|uniref:Paromamine 6'-oxidase/6'''-hydroxyneomycin C oxidase/2'-deamino-2'-hydroxyparomamine 6'-oxidase n=1 Tax=Nonomuraea roseoviolacea subsp. carminata TaxID=160689 RepID=A0ABT1KCA2_9ACTN|nr:GMC family oxidoreductase [Nonomuraea roseoviolacea]MCP2351249.1 paromamine 6'-oxidase/6'''-hydroxyneomycin C oxidase/2'-deamino-2'-hydroxyparomamine 6'-oxidase [Nonomuraea roseoviolacea subsp. carminata]
MNASRDATVLYRSADVCVVGSGPGGAVTAHLLARAGLRVLLLEEGGRIGPGATLDALEPGWEPALVRAGAGRPVPAGRPWSARGLGGGMGLFAGIGFRLRHVDLDARKHVADDALDPRWPLAYADLREHYDAVERLMGVARARGADPLEPDGDDPPLPPHPYSPPGLLLAGAGRRLGLRPFPTPLLINSAPYRGRPACHRCGPCNEHACPTGAKADLVATLLDPAAEDGSLVVATESRALRVHASSGDRADAVEWLDGRAGVRRTTRARCVVLAGNAVQSSALLLRSPTRWSPSGLGNRHDVVGRGLCFKVSGYVAGTVAAPAATGHGAGGPFSTVAFSDHYLDPACPGGLGGILYEASPADRAPRDGEMPLRVHYLAADQPMWRNRVRLSNRKNALGTEKLLMEYETHPLDEARLEYLAERATELLVSAGAAHIRREASGYERGSRHLHGGCRAGDDPRTSVVDADGRIHDQENVYVVDGGFFPYPGGVNPTLTILANAARIARRIARDLATASV